MFLPNYNESFRPQTLEEFILSNKDIRRRYLVRKTIDGKITEDYVEFMINDWSSIIETYFKPILLSTQLKKEVAFYCELIKIHLESSHYLNSNIRPGHNTGDGISIEIKKRLNIIHKNIVDNPKRVKIMGKYFNYTTGKSEYLLEDGKYVKTDGSEVPIIEMDYSLFPQEFVMLINMSEYRNSKIDQII